MNLPQIEFSDPVAAARGVAARLGITLTDRQATDIVKAVLATADSIVYIKQNSWRDEWDKNEDLRAFTRQKMRAQLLRNVFDAGRVPTELPTEVVTYTGHGYVIHDAEIVLYVPVRTPPPVAQS